MINTPQNNKARPRPNLFPNAKSLPRLSLSLHTMPQTSTSHFRKWLLLGILIFCLFALVAFLLFN